MKNLFTLFIIFFSIISCERNNEKSADSADFLVLNDTIELSFRNCLHNNENDLSLCFDSVLSDSRCPEGLHCIWEGNAEAKFTIFANDTIPFVLNTSQRFRKDTLINRYHISLIGIEPAPLIESPVPQADYKVRIKVEKVN